MRALLPIGAMMLACTVLAQSPQAFNYQAVARDAGGAPVSGQPVSVRYVLRSGVPLGPAVYEETHATVTDQFGVFSLHVGEGTASIGMFSSIDWRSGPYFLEVGVDISSSGSYVSVGTQQLMSVPYALHAGSSGDVPDGTEVGQIMHWDGAVWVADSGIYVFQKRFGIGITTPEAPLGIVADSTDGSAVKIYQASTTTPGAFNPAVWNINLNPTGNDVSGFSIDDASSGIGTSRLFIADTTGNVGIGTTEPEAPLAIQSRDYLYEKFQNGDIPDGQDFVISSGGNTGLSIDQDTVGGSVSRLFIDGSTGHVGIGDPEPEAPLSIESRDVLKTYFQTGDIPTQDNFAITTDSTGFGIGQGTPGSLVSRLFIEKNEGNVGLGTVEPTEKLHLEHSTSLDITGIKMLNTATANSQGWKLGHLQDALAERDGALLFSEPVAFSPGQGLGRMIIRQGGNVGINEPVPDTKLHVSRDLADPGAALDLQEGTGIVVIGPITDNVVFDYRGIQARTGEYVGGGPTLTVTAGTLDLQRLGGDILIHGDDALASSKGILTSDGKLGLGTITPAEKIEIDGAIKIGNSLGSEDGTIRFNGTDFEGRVAGDWVVFSGNVWEKVDNTSMIYYNTGTTPRVGIGTNTVDATLHIRGGETCDEGSGSAIIHNHSTTTSTSSDDNRVGLEIKNDGTWSSNAEAKNIGLLVSAVTGQAAAASNIAAVMNGNVVVGGISSSEMVGTGGTNVLSIQNGTAPSSAVGGSTGTTDNGVQLYSATDVSGVSVFHVMTGDGDVIKLYRSPDMTPADPSTVDGTYDGSEAAVIENMRTRINQLETILKNLGLLEP